MHKIKGDENCLFSVLCYGATGSQIDCPKVCQLITNHVSAKGTYTGVHGWAYLNDIRMRDVAVCTTDT